MKHFFTRFSVLILLLYTFSQTAFAARLLIPGGQVIGMHLADGTVTVSAVTDQGKHTGLAAGDRLLTIDGAPVSCAEDVRKALSCSDGTVKISLLRGEKTKNLTLRPTVTADGPRLGVLLRQGTTGLGTVTYYENDTFGALGHGINDPTGKMLKMQSGSVYEAKISGVKRGDVGAPGQLLGAVTRQEATGSLSKNTPQGVFGSAPAASTQPLPAATAQDVHPGKATIRSTVSDAGLQEYSVEILKIYPNAQNKTRNMLIRVTDPALLAATGGIVQGMSGSPLVQDGKLIGAVTHVLVNDPTMGYGIFIENMLEAAG